MDDTISGPAFRITWDLDRSLSTWEGAESYARDLLDRHPDRQPGYEVFYDVRALFGFFQLWHGSRPLFPAAHFRTVGENASRSYPELGMPLPPILGNEELARLERRGFGGTSLPSLAVQFSRIADPTGFAQAPEGATARYRNPNDEDSLKFLKRDMAVVVSSSQVATSILVVPGSQFFAGLEGFLRSFAAEVATRTPTLLRLEALGDLRPYAPATDLP